VYEYTYYYYYDYVTHIWTPEYNTAQKITIPVSESQAPHLTEEVLKEAIASIVSKKLDVSISTEMVHVEIQPSSEETVVTWKVMSIDEEGAQAIKTAAQDAEFATMFKDAFDDAYAASAHHIAFSVPVPTVAEAEVTVPHHGPACLLPYAGMTCSANDFSGDWEGNSDNCSGPILNVNAEDWGAGKGIHFTEFAAIMFAESQIVFKVDVFRADGCNYKIQAAPKQEDNEGEEQIMWTDVCTVDAAGEPKVQEPSSDSCHNFKHLGAIDGIRIHKEKDSNCDEDVDTAVSDTELEEAVVGATGSKWFRLKGIRIFGPCQPDESIYALGPLNEEKCAGDLAVVDSEAKCVEAAESLGLAYSGTTSHFPVPSSCYYGAADGVRFNEAVGVRSDEDYKLVCVKVWTASPTASPTAAPTAGPTGVATTAQTLAAPTAAPMAAPITDRIADPIADPSAAPTGGPSPADDGLEVKSVDEEAKTESANGEWYKRKAKKNFASGLRTRLLCALTVGAAWMSNL
jgi:hypothetical protein